MRSLVKVLERYSGRREMSAGTDGGYNAKRPAYPAIPPDRSGTRLLRQNRFRVLI
jgi:hypothetical protein